ncbi:hypothetical protein PA598K_03997 [Paenibacillus sp. 598K]|uniref:hypothetical protein n=1 Tax=Paenibacillus sp. 598K TaxID=1117987 RepID=UPI000FFAC56B|nr:hypothetical protein [Paenibacillus sp. 598K]GBF75579.1 hypothetical protein PA598K_03997 [Paenibacillus sp. 598K]
MLSKPIAITLLALIACLSIGIVYLSSQTKADDYLSAQKIEALRADYPIYDKDPDFLSTVPLSFQDVFEGVDSVVIGSVVEALPEYSITLPLESEADKAVDEKNKELGFDPRREFVQYKLKVEKLIAGEAVDDEIILSHNAMFVGIEPELKPGMELLLGLSKGMDMHEGKYFFSRYGTYYIVEDDYVLPAYEDQVSKTLTGASLTQLIDTIKSYRND